MSGSRGSDESNTEKEGTNEALEISFHIFLPAVVKAVDDGVEGKRPLVEECATAGSSGLHRPTMSSVDDGKRMNLADGVQGCQKTVAL